MGGSSKKTSTTKTNQSQQSSSQLGSTPFATPFLPQYAESAQNAANMGGYMGDVVAAPTQATRYTPQVDRFIADPGAPLNDYTPDVQILDRYIEGATPTSRQGLQGAIDFAGGAGGAQVSSTAANMGDYWNRVSQGEFFDPNQNTALQQYLALMSEGARDEFDRGAAQFRSQAIDSGAFGGTGYGRGMAWGLDEFNENDLAQRAAVLYGNYSDEMARMERATGGAADAFSLGLLPGQTMMGLGDVERGYNQLDINDTLARNQEIERGQGLDILDAEQRRRDTALQAQANIDNEVALQTAGIQDELLRNQVDQQIRQAGLTNDASQFDAQRFGEMEAWERYFQGLANPAFGESSRGTMSGTSTTTQTQKNPIWQDVLGAASAVSQMFGALNGGGGMAAGGGQPAQTGGQPQAPAGFQPMNIPQIDYSRYFSNPAAQQTFNQVPWYLQQAYAAQQGGG